MKIWIFIMLFFCSDLVYGQNDTIFYYSKLNRVVYSKDSAYYSAEITKNNKGKYILTENIKSDRKWEKTETYKIQNMCDTSYDLISITHKNYNEHWTFNKTDSGYYLKEFVKSDLLREGFSKTKLPLVFEGNWKEYHRYNHKITVESIYKENQLISNKYWTLSGTCINDVFRFVDKEPSYEGGYSELQKFINSNIHYPQTARDNNIMGRVILRFVLTKEGKISGIDFLGHVNPDIDLEAIRVIKLIPEEKWTPAEIDNKKVNTFLSLPITFELR